MNWRPTLLSGVIVIEPVARSDPRGFFLEVWHSARYAEFGVPASFAQDNISRSARNILRGLHLQEPFGQGKLVQVLEGEVFDVAVDVRVGSPTFGQWVGEHLSSDNHLQMYIPPGCAHGFCVLSSSALLSYKCTEFYRPEVEIGVAWNDPALGIPWPTEKPILSKKDAMALRLEEWPRDRLPQWTSSPATGGDR